LVFGVTKNVWSPQFAQFPKTHVTQATAGLGCTTKMVSEYPSLIPAKENDGNARTNDEQKQISQDQTMSILLIRDADHSSYGTFIITDLSNQYALQRNTAHFL
jgi:hypothetical protein